VAKIDRRDRKLAVIANRIRQNTKSFDKLMRFLDSLDIPIIGILRDSQSFVHAVESGVGVADMPRRRVQREVEELEKIVAWLDGWQERRRAVAVPEPLPTLAVASSSPGKA